MKKVTKFFLLFLISLIIVNNNYSQNVVIDKNHDSYKIDFTNPVSVVNALIFASKTKNLELASIVFNPFAQSGQLYRNKTLYLTKDIKVIEEFNDFGNSYINGTFIMTGFDDTGYIPVWWKTSRKEFQEKIYLRKYFGNWFIHSL